MCFLRDIPIKRKLTWITMLSSCVALLLACVIFVTYEQITLRHTMSRDFSVLADVIDDNVAPGLTFNDRGSIDQALKSLDAHAHILAAGVYDKTGKLVAQYHRRDVDKELPFPAARETTTRFVPDRLDTFRTITLAGEVIGTLYLASDLKELTARFWRYAVIVGLVLGVSSLVAFALAAKLQKVIAEPISQLARVAGMVAGEKN